MSDFDLTIRDERDRLRMLVNRLEQENEALEKRIVLLTIQVGDLQRQVNDAVKWCAKFDSPPST